MLTLWNCVYPGGINAGGVRCDCGDGVDASDGGGGGGWDCCLCCGGGSCGGGEMTGGKA